MDFHALRHTYGSLLAKAGIAPRVAMSLMRHTDMRLTMNVYTDPRIFDLSGAVEKLPALEPAKLMPLPMLATGTDDIAIATDTPKKKRSEFVSSPSAVIGNCLEVIGKTGSTPQSTLTLAIDRARQQKTPTGMVGGNERAKGLEPSTASLEG